MGRSERPFVDRLRWLSSPQVSWTTRRLQQNSTEDGSRLPEALQSRALGGRCDMDEGWEGCGRV